MNSKRRQQVRERRQINQENRLIRRRNWTLNGGPFVISDTPDDEHVRGLLLHFVKRYEHPFELQLKSSPVVARPRKLRAIWSVEVHTAMMAFSDLMPSSRTEPLASLLANKSGW